jgi:Spy/CpxP family protein refolding chaperone
MKLQWITGTLMVGALAISSMAQVEHRQSPGNGDVVTAEPSDHSADNLADNSESPLSPQDTLNTYEQQMALVTVQTYAELAQIAQAVREGRISSAQGQYLARHQYELGIIRLQFLDTLHETVETNSPKEGQSEKPEQPTSEVKTLQQALVVVPAAASPDIPEAIAKHLALTPVQIAAIQARATEQHKQVQPLLEQLSRSQKALASATQDTRFNNNHIRKLASEQSHIMEQLIVADSRLQRDVYELLTPAQREKLEEMRQEPATQSLQVQIAPESSLEHAGQIFAGIH